MQAEKEGEWVFKSLLFQAGQAVREEVLKHKWYESEKAGYDIGWDRACVDWMIRYGDKIKWRNSR